MIMKAKVPVRYAVVGLGHIAQVAVLPAFRHAANSRLAAIVSGDPKKLKTLGRKYRVPRQVSYEDYEDLLQSGLIDAVYIAEPNDLHLEFAFKAAKAGVHLLVEKPLAVTEADCRSMIEAARNADIRLMTAYRLHFDPATLQALKVLRSGELGELRFFDATFSMQVRNGNIRTKKERGGGPLLDLGVYCINAARQMFGAEPTEVFAMAESLRERRFGEIDEMVSVQLRFPQARLASFVVSFGAANTGAFTVVGTRGSLRLDPAFEYAEPASGTITVDDRSRTQDYRKHDQFAAELVYFSDCIQNDTVPEPDGEEGLADVRVVDALERSLRSGKPIRLPKLSHQPGMNSSQRILRPPVSKPRTIHTQEPHTS